jgi:hypothetical protein
MRDHTQHPGICVPKSPTFSGQIRTVGEYPPVLLLVIDRTAVVAEQLQKFVGVSDTVSHEICTSATQVQ